MFDVLMKKVDEVRYGGLKYAVNISKAHKLCDDCMEFYKKNHGNYDDVDSITNDWHTLFVKVCKYFGINKSSANVLWEDMCLGNWHHLWMTDDEKKKPANEWLDDFIADVFYCSDRWSLDRLMRCHWTYRQWVYRQRISARKNN